MALYDRPSGLWVTRADGTGERRLVAGGQDRAEWSPDGRSIAYTSREDIYVVRADGSHLVRVATRGESPEWTTDGKKIVYLRDQRGRRSGIYSVAAAGGKPRRLAALPAHELRLSGISPDGRWALVEHYPGLAAVSLHGGAVRRLTRQVDYFADWQQIVFLRHSDVWRVDAYGGKATLVRRRRALCLHAGTVEATVSHLPSTPSLK